MISFEFKHAQDIVILYYKVSKGIILEYKLHSFCWKCSHGPWHHKIYQAVKNVFLLMAVILINAIFIPKKSSQYLSYE